MHAVPNVGETNSARALVGKYGEGSLATAWHCVKKSKLTIKISPNISRLQTLTASLSKSREITAAHINHRPGRLTLFFDNLQPENALEILGKAVWNNHNKISHLSHLRPFAFISGAVSPNPGITCHKICILIYKSSGATFMAIKIVKNSTKQRDNDEDLRKTQRIDARS